MQMLRRIVVIVSVVVTASVHGRAVDRHTGRGHDREEVRRQHHPCHRRDRGTRRRTVTGTPGFVVGIWDPKHGTLVKGYGTGDLFFTDPKATSSIDDHVRIASVTKSFTATAILQLVAAKKLSLDDHLSEFVPDIANGDSITVEQLLGMTAGVFSYTEDDTFVTNYFAEPADSRSPRRMR